MTGRMGHETGQNQGRRRGLGDQAHWLLLAVLVAGCSPGAGPESIGPVLRRMVGPAFEGREPPPGTAAEFPNLGTVPPRPAVADPAVRDALTAALAEERQRSRNPFEPETRPLPVRPAGTQGDAAMPMHPPGPPPLAAAPRIPLGEPALAPAAPAVRAPGQAPAPAAPAGPAAPPLPEMEPAPPAPPPAELLAPDAAPPPPPPAELLAPRP